MLDAGTRVTEVDNDGRVALILAAQEGHVTVVTTLIERGTPLESHGHDGRTALRAAAAAADNIFEVIRYLVNAGANVNACDADGRTALYALAVDGRVDTATLLLNAGADASITDTEGRSPLHAAAWHGHRDFVQLLLDHGVDCDISDKEGRTPLHSAAWQGHTNVVTLLIERGVRVNHVCLQGATALCVAAQEGHEGVVRALLRAGADPTRADRCGRTPARVAARGGHAGIVRLLKEHATSGVLCLQNGCGTARQHGATNSNQTSSSSTESALDARRPVVGLMTNTQSTNQSSSSSGAGGGAAGVENHSLTFTQQLQQCSLSPVREPSSVPSYYATPRARASSSDEMIIEPIWQRRSESRRPGAMVMGRTALAMNSPEIRRTGMTSEPQVSKGVGGVESRLHVTDIAGELHRISSGNKQRNSNGIITNPGYSPTTPDVTLYAPSRGIYANPSESSDDGTSNKPSKQPASRPSGLALKRETPL